MPSKTLMHSFKITELSINSRKFEDSWEPNQNFLSFFNFLKVLR